MTLVLCGLPSLVENLAKSKSYTERMFNVEELGNLRPPEDKRALTEPAAHLGRTYTEETVSAVLDDTAGYPVFIQLYGDQILALECTGAGAGSAKEQPPDGIPERRRCPLHRPEGRCRWAKWVAHSGRNERTLIDMSGSFRRPESGTLTDASNGSSRSPTTKS